MKLLEAVTRAASMRTKARSAGFGETGSWVNLFGSYDRGWFQKDIPPVGFDRAASHYAFYACLTLIAADIGKLRYTLTALDKDGIWTETTSPAFSPVLRKPNRYQNHIQFKEWWLISKLTAGNAYALKQRDTRGVVVALYLLDPRAVRALVAPDGEVFYSLGADNLSGVQTSVNVPASEVIHDRMNCLFHPLIGIPPIFACGIASEQGLRIQTDAAVFFGNSSSPSGILTSPDAITKEQRDTYREEWKTKFAGANAGRIAVLGGGLKFEPMRMTAVDSQMVDHLKMSAEIICSTFHVPGYKVGVGPAPLNNNVDALDQQYYSQCLQTHIESMEACLDEGLGLDTPKGGIQLGVALDLDGLLRMDQKAQMETLKLGVDGTIIAPNEARRKINLKPKAGGDELWKQQQNYSLEALAKRDANSPAPSSVAPTPPADSAPAPAAADEAAAKFLADLVKRYDEAVHG